MYNLMLQPNAFRFLLEIETGQKVNWSEFPWDNVYQGYRHIPQIEFENIILAKEKWFLDFDDLNIKKNSKFKEFCQALTEYRINNQIPASVCLTDFDNKMPLNLEEEMAKWIIFDEMKKKKGESILLERIDLKYSEVLYKSGKKYPTEVVVPLFRKKTEEYTEKIEKEEFTEYIRHLVFPYENWLYIRAYCKKEREIELIALQLRKYGKDLMNKYGIEHFFMRYMDPRPHIRIRFYGSSDKLMQASPEILKWMKRMVEQSIIGDFNISVYEREIERYGGEDLIEYAESLFRIDSIIVEEILYYKRIRQLEIDELEIAIFSIMKYVMQFYKDYDSQLAFLTKYYHSNNFIQEFREKKKNFYNYMI